MSNSSTLSSDQLTPNAPSAVAELLAAINADDAEAMAAALQRIDNEQGRDGAVAIASAVVPAGLTRKLLDALVKRGASLNTAEAWRQAAEAAFVLQDLDVVQRAATEALKHDPTVPSASFMLAAIANHQARYDEALKIIDSLVAVVPQAGSDPFIIVQQALARLGTNQPQTALSSLDFSIETLTSAGLGFDAEILRARALAALPDRRSDALTAYERALVLATPAQAPSARDEYTAELLKARNFPKALEQIDLMISAANEVTVVGLREVRAKILTEMGDINGAVAELDDLTKITRDPQQRVSLLLVQARLEASRQHWKESADHFDEALQETQSSAEKRTTQMEKAQRLAAHDISLVLADLDELDASLTGPGWPVTIDIRITGLLAAGRAEDARAWLDQRLANAPELAQHPAANQLRGDIQIKLGQLDLAMDAYARAAEVAPGETDPRAWGASLAAAFATQKWREVVTAFERLTELNPQAIDDTVKVLAGLAYAREGALETALKLTESAAALPPTIVAVRDQARAEVQLRLQRYDEAIKTAEEGLRREGIPPEYGSSLQLIRAQAFNQEKKFKAAREAATAVIDRADDAAEAVTGTIAFLRLSARMQRSAASYSLGDTSAAHEDIDAAIHGFEKLRDTAVIKILKTGPDFDSLETSIWQTKAAVLGSENRIEEALAAYTRADGLTKQGNTTAIGRGHAFASLGAFEDALQVFEEALERATTPAERSAAFTGKGRALVSLERYEEAMTALHAALEARLTESNDKDPLPFELLGIAYESLGRNEVALRAFERAWALTSKNQRGPNLARGITKANLKLGRPAAAIRFLNELVEPLASDESLVFNRALALEALGERKEAIKILMSAHNVSNVQSELDRLQRPDGLGRWADPYWFGWRAPRRRRLLGRILLVLAILVYLAPLYQLLLTGTVDWYLLLVPSLVSIVLLALPSMKTITIEAGNVKVSAESAESATGLDASATTTPEKVTVLAAPALRQPLGAVGSDVPRAPLGPELPRVPDQHLPFGSPYGRY